MASGPKISRKRDVLLHFAIEGEQSNVKGVPTLGRLVTLGPKVFR